MIHLKNCYVLAIIGGIFLFLFPPNGFAQTFNLQEHNATYVAYKDSTVTIKWPKSISAKSLSIRIEEGTGTVYYNLNNKEIVYSGAILNINRYDSLQVRLKKWSEGPLTLVFFTKNQSLKATITFVDDINVSPKALKFDILAFNRSSNKTYLSAKKEEQLTIRNPSGDTLHWNLPNWLIVSPKFVLPYSESTISLYLDPLKIADTINQHNIIWFSKPHYIKKNNVSIDKKYDLRLESLEKVLIRDIVFVRTVGLGIVISSLAGGIFAFLFFKKRKEKRAYHKIKQYMENKFVIDLEPTEEGILNGLAKILATLVNARSQNRIEDLISSYQSKINSLSQGEIGEISSVEVVDTGDDAHKVAEIINGLITLFNEKIKIHQRQWEALALCLGQSADRTFLSEAEGIKNLVAVAQAKKDESDSRLKQIGAIVKSQHVSWDDLVEKIKYNFDNLDIIINYLKNTFKIPGDDPIFLVRSLDTWKEQNDKDWHSLSQIANIAGSNAEIISKLKDMKREVDDICKAYEQKDLVSVKNYINKEKKENEQMLDTFAKSLGIQNVSPQSIIEGIISQHALIDNVIGVLSAKASVNAPGSDFIIKKDNLIEVIEGLRDPNFGKPPGFPDFVHDFKNNLKIVEQELKLILDTMRRTNETLFTKLLERAYLQEGRQKGVKPALDILSDDSKLKNQLKINANEMQYVKEFDFYDKFVKEYLDAYTNDLAKIYAYSKVDQASINMADILSNQHNINKLHVFKMCKYLFLAYEKIGITLLVPSVFEDYFDSAQYESSQSASSFLVMYDGKYSSIFDQVKNSIIYDIDEIGMNSEVFDIHKKPKVFRK